jgi:predicted acyltransferase (DUF342 family)
VDEERVRPTSDAAGEVKTPAEHTPSVFGSDPLEALAIPDGTHVKERDLVTDGDVLVGGQSVVELGVRGGSVLAGERVTFGGDIEADGDCRLDMWCEVDGNVLVGSDAYLGERVHITGQLIVSGDLDIGDDVDIERGFEANGWIVIRNPMPTIVFLFVYLSHLLHIGEEEAAEEVAAEAFDDRDAEPATIPRGSRVSDDAWRVSTPASIGDDCRLHGNIRAAEIEVGRNTEVFGSLRSKGPIRIGNGTVVHGDVTTRGGDVTIEPGVHVRGDISCDRCELSEIADVDGTIRAREGIRFEEPPNRAVETGADGASSQTPPDREVDGDGEDGAGSDDGDDGSESERAVSPAVVPIGDGALPKPESGSNATLKTAAEVYPGADRIAAVVPLGENDIEWDALDDRRSNGSGADDVAAIIADAEVDPGPDRR